MTDTHAANVQGGLLEALRLALQVLDAAQDEDEALRNSFRAAAQGVGAERSFLARVNTEGDVTEVLEAHGLGRREVEALCYGRSSPGVSASVVRQALRSGSTQHVEDTRQVSGDLERTGALVGGEWSVVCAPVIDPRTRAPLAILYFQTHSETHPLGVAVVPHIQSYATALAQAWHTWRRVQNELATARSATGGSLGPEIIGESAAMLELREQIHTHVLPAIDAPRPDPVLILGPTGVGKDLVARYLHAHSGRARGPYVAVNCASLQGDLVQKEMFGHTAGAYTGSVGESLGRFMEAQEGVLFLDEVGDMPPEGQVLLLRAIETRRVRAVGAREERSVDVLLVCATNVDLEKAVAQGRFRADLYHRISGFTLHVAPLSARRDDILPLLSHYLGLHERRYRKRTLGLSRETRALLLGYAWPGNVRELELACSALVACTAAGQWITLEVLRKARPAIYAAARESAPELTLDQVAARPSESLTAKMRELERIILERAERRFPDNRAAMARHLGIDRKSLYRRLVRTGLVTPGERDEEETDETDESEALPDTPAEAAGADPQVEDDDDERV